MQPVSGKVAGLPEVDEASSAHSTAVAAHIRGLIDAGGGSISFAEYMQAALYAPALGYYVAGARKLGRAGDFVTAPEVSPLFGRVLARLAAPVLEQVGSDIFELGAGSGALAVSVLGKLDEVGMLPERYLVLEVSPDLRERQMAHISSALPRLADRVHWLSAMPKSFSGVVIANEVADAIPVERFRIRAGHVEQARVAYEAQQFVWQFAEAPDDLESLVRRIEADLGAPLPDGYESEVSPGLVNWAGELSAAIHEGLLLMIDYGVSRREYYANERSSGWLRCHFRHHAHDDPLILPGIQDLTAWVDFSAVAEAAQRAGLQVSSYLTQAHLLLGGGLEHELAEFVDLPIDEQVRLSGQVKLLTLPAEMGESFKCLALCRGSFELDPVFSSYSRAHTL